MARGAVTIFTLMGCLGLAMTGNPRREPLPGLMIQPYLTHLGTDSVTINWRLKEPSLSVLTLGETLDAKGLKTLILPESRQHSATVGGLEPDTVYHYRVNNRFQGHFQTYPDDGALQFAVIGHTHGTEAFDHFPDTLLAARIENLRPHFVVHLGDAAYYANPTNFKRHFFELFGSLFSRIPVYLAPGNHDAGWPFVYGAQPQAFHALFDYQYHPGNEEALYHAARLGNMLFLFLSYTAPIGPGSSQRQWIETQLRESDADFKIVVFGGAQRQYYDEGSLLAFLGNQALDLILRGDGFQPKESQSQTAGIPTLTLGTSGSGPHHLVFGQADRDRMVLTEMDANGAKKQALWVYNRQPQPAKVELRAGAPGINFENGRLTHTVWLPEPISSTAIQGLQLRVVLRQEQTAKIFAYITPADIQWEEPLREPGFRTNHYDFGTQDQLLTLRFPREDPFRGEPYDIIRVIIHIEGLVTADNLIIIDMYLF